MTRIKHLAIGILCAGVIAGTASVENAAAAAHRFGDAPGSSPFQAVQAAAAQAHLMCSSKLSTNRLTALMLSVPWNEITGHDTNLTPGPMTLGRNDHDPDLSMSSRPRAFWHPGVGVWQLDDSGLGSKGAAAKFYMIYPAQVIAKDMATRVCSGKPVFAPFFGCNNRACNKTLAEIYTANGDRLRNLTPDRSVDIRGGSSDRLCLFGGKAVGCRYVNPNRAQGEKAYWTSDPDGRTGLSPLTKPFYAITQFSGGQIYEYRVWSKVDTGYGTTTTARRTIPSDSRSGLRWSRTMRLCDVTARRGDC